MKTYIEQLLGDVAALVQTRKNELARKQDEQERILSTADESYRNKIAFAQHIAEVERYLQEDPPADQDMYYHFGLRRELLPPIDRLTDDEAETLTSALLDLWGAYNFDASFPDGIPAKILYPLLLDKMHEPTFINEIGWTTHEFCSYECEHCPFGLEWCMCKEIGEY